MITKLTEKFDSFNQAKILKMAEKYGKIGTRNLIYGLKDAASRVQ